MTVCHYGPTASETLVPYGITQCYLPPVREDIPPLPQPIKAGTRFSYPGRRQDWVDLVCSVIYILSWHTCSRRSPIPVLTWAQCRVTSFMRRTTLPPVIAYMWLCGCVSVCVLALKEKRLELSTPNVVDICSAYSSRSSWIDSRSQGKGRAVIKCAAGVGMQVDITA